MRVHTPSIAISNIYVMIPRSGYEEAVVKAAVAVVEAAVALEAQSNLSGACCTMREDQQFHTPTLIEKQWPIQTFF